MARRIRDNRIGTRETRLKLPVAKKPVFTKIGPKVSLGYRRNATAGTWVVRVADGKGGNWTRAFATADDFQEADGSTILDFWQATERGRVIARMGQDGSGDDGKPVTVAKALDRYESDLRMRGGQVGNVTRVRHHLPDALADKAVLLVTVEDLRAWRDRLTKTLAPSSVNRSATAFKAALNHLADTDKRFVSRQAWEMGLATIPNAEQSRNVILTEPEIHRIIEEASAESAEFGLLIEVAAVTGARVSQLARIETQDVQTDRADPRLMMPASRKGRGQRKVTRRPVPITTSLALRLHSLAAGRADDAVLLTKPSGQPWKVSEHTKRFRRTVLRAGLDESVTMYALRHSNIVRQLLAGVPIRVVATNHDTSVLMIEKTYSQHIGDHADALTRGALLEHVTPPAGGNVVALRAEV